jgi:hypothetical protein
MDRWQPLTDELVQGYRLRRKNYDPYLQKELVV